MSDLIPTSNVMNFAITVPESTKTGSPDDEIICPSSRIERSRMLAAVKRDGLALRCADERFRNDREIVLAAVRQNGLALQYASESLKRDQNLVLAAILQNAAALQYADESLRRNRAIVLAAIRVDGLALQYAHECLRSSRDVVLAALKQNGLALQYASEELRADREIVLAAVRQRGTALHFAAESLKQDREMILAAVSQDSSYLSNLDDSFKQDREIILAAAKRNGYYALQFASEELRRDREIVLAAVRSDGRALAYADEAFKADREIVLAAVRSDGQALAYADEVLKADREIVLAAVKQNGNALANADESLRGDWEIALAAVNRNGEALQYVAESLRGNLFLASAAVAKNIDALQYVDPQLKRNHEFQNTCFYYSFFSYNQMLDPSPELTERYEEIVDDLEDLEIDHLGGFEGASLNQIQEIIRNREENSPDNRPLAVIAYAEDPDFHGYPPLLIDLMDHGYRVAFYEVRTDNDIYDAIRETGEVQRISLLLIGGHGSQTDITLAGRNPDLADWWSNDLYNFGINDRDDLWDLRRYLGDESVIVLESCLTGQGRARASNVANMLGTVFTNSYVFAETESTALGDFVFNDENHVKGVCYVGGDEYSISPSPFRQP